MKKIRKILSIFFVFVMMVHLMSVTFSAYTVNDFVGGIYVYAEPCPAEALEYAVSSYVRFARGYLEGNGMVGHDRVSIGQPFTVNNGNNSVEVYYFPIFSNGEIIATFRVYDGGNGSESVYTGVMSSFLAYELNELSTGSLQGVRLTYSNRTLYSDSIAFTSAQNVLKNGEVVELRRVNLSSMLSACDISVESNVEVKAVGDGRKFLTLPISEKQEDTPNCGAYATAAILRFLRGSPTVPSATTLMVLSHGVNSTQTTFTYEDLEVVARHFGFSPEYANAALSQSSAISEINNNRPVYMGNDVTYDDGRTGEHAMVLRGYDTVFGIYSVWNTYYTTYDVMDMSTLSYYEPDFNCTLRWERSYYGW